MGSEGRHAWASAYLPGNLWVRAATSAYDLCPSVPRHHQGAPCPCPCCTGLAARRPARRVALAPLPSRLAEPGGHPPPRSAASSGRAGCRRRGGARAARALSHITKNRKVEVRQLLIFRMSRRVRLLALCRGTRHPCWSASPRRALCRLCGMSRGCGRCMHWSLNGRYPCT